MNARSFKSFCDGPISLAERSATKNKGPGRLSGNLKRVNGGRRTAKLLKILQHLDELGSCLRDHLDELVVWDLIVIYRLPQDLCDHFATMCQTEMYVLAARTSLGGLKEGGSIASTT